jgi:hypothetical protein
LISDKSARGGRGWTERSEGSPGISRTDIGDHR